MGNSYHKTINELVEYLNVCRDEYYNHNNSIITDEQYDDLFDKLNQLENESGIILSNSPTQTVGYTVVSELQKVEHARPLLSLDKTKSYNDIYKFCNNDTLFMHKLDGLTCCLTYENGELIRAETRGDGIIGEDITHNALTFIGVPRYISSKYKTIITGEAIINKKDFDYINSKLDVNDRYRNPRNLASGSVRQLDSSICSERKVRFIVWNANDLSDDGTMLSGLINAEKQGFNIVHCYRSSVCPKETDIEAIINNMRKRAINDYIPIDGIVVMYNNIKYGESLGKTSHHFKNGIAFKFYDEDYETIITDIKYTIGKTGVLTPVAEFEPVEIDGTIITKASVHNLSILKQLNLCVGDSVTIYKANEIIPQIRENKTKHNDEFVYKSTIYTKCPYCGEKTVYETSSEGVTNLVCKNRYCDGILLKQLSSFVSKPAMNIDGLSEKTLEKFIHCGWIKCYSDIYTLIDNHKLDIIRMEGFGEKSVKSLETSIEKSVKTTLERLLIAINIDGIGKANAKQLSEYFDNDPNKLISEFTTRSYIPFTEIDGFGEIMSQDINKWFRDKDNLNEFIKLVKILSFYNTEVKSSEKLKDITFVITGSLTQWKNRDELISYITSNGGTVASSVSKSTNYLINNDSSSTTGKNKKAHELNIPIITEQEFMDMFMSETDYGLVEEKPKEEPKSSRKKLF